MYSRTGIDQSELQRVRNFRELSAGTAEGPLDEILSAVPKGTWDDLMTSACSVYSGIQMLIFRKHNAALFLRYRSRKTVHENWSICQEVTFIYDNKNKYVINVAKLSILTFLRFSVQNKEVISYFYVISINYKDFFYTTLQVFQNVE